MKKDRMYYYRATVWMSKEMRKALRKVKKQRKVSLSQLIREAIENEYGEYFDT